MRRVPGRRPKAEKRALQILTDHSPMLREMAFTVFLVYLGLVVLWVSLPSSRGEELGCAVSPPGGIYSPAGGQADFNVSCQPGVPGWLTVCPDPIVGGDLTTCRHDEEGGGGGCSDFRSGCHNVSSGGDGGVQLTFSVRSGEAGVKCVLLSLTERGRDSPRLTQALNVFAKYSERDEEEDRILFWVQLALTVTANFFVGTCLDLEQIRRETHKMLMTAVSVRQWDPGSFFTVRAWKLGFLAQLVLLPVLSYLIGLALFRESAECGYASDLSRLGLFVLGTSPAASYCSWVCSLFAGNMDVSVLVVLISVLLNPLSVLLWWRTLGQDMNVAFPADIPFEMIYSYLAIVSAPVLAGAVFAWCVPSLEGCLKRLSQVQFAAALAAVMVLTGFHAARIHLIYSWQYALAGVGLPVASGLLVCLVAVISNLERDRIVAVSTSTAQSAFLAHWVLLDKFENPVNEFLAIPAHSQSLLIPLILSLGLAGLWAKRLTIGQGDVGLKVLKALKRIGGGGAKEDGEEQNIFGAENADVQHSPLNRNRIWVNEEELHPLWM